MLGAADLDGARAWRRCRCSGRRNTPCEFSSIRRRWRRGRSASTKSPTAVQNANVNLPTGTLYGEHKAFTVQANGQLTRASLYRPLIVAYRNGSPVRLDELGNVIDSVQNDKVANWYNDGHAVILAVQRQPGTNTVEVVDAVKQMLPQFRGHSAAFGQAGRDLRPFGSRSGTSVDDVKVHAFPRGLPRGAGDLPVPAQPFGDGDPEPRAADVDHRHFRRDVPAGLQRSTTCR